MFMSWLKSVCDGCKDQNINTETTEKNGGHREIGSSAGEAALISPWLRRS